MADLTSYIPSTQRVNVDAGGLNQLRAYRIDLSKTSLAGGKATGTHNIITIPAGYAVKSGIVIVETSADSAGDAATVQFSLNSDAVTTAIAQAELAAGQVIPFDLAQRNDAGGVTGGSTAYAASAAITLDMIVGTEALTAFKFIVQLEVVDVASLTTNG